MIGNLNFLSVNQHLLNLHACVRCDHQGTAMVRKIGLATLAGYDLRLLYRNIRAAGRCRFLL